MAYDLEEQEQISELKAWWALYGKLVTTGVLAVTIGVVGFLWWRNYERSQTAQASAIFAAVQTAASQHDAMRAREAAGELLAKFSGTPYAAMGALAAAKVEYEAGDVKTAQAELQWVVNNASDDELRDIARLRLAGVLFDQKSYDAALRLLAAEPMPAFAPRYAELQGDILAAQGKRAAAKVAYQEALTKLDAAQKAVGKTPDQSVYRQMLQTKLDSIEGQ